MWRNWIFAGPHGCVVDRETPSFTCTARTPLSISEETQAKLSLHAYISPCTELSLHVHLSMYTCTHGSEYSCTSLVRQITYRRTTRGTSSYSYTSRRAHKCLRTHTFLSIHISLCRNISVNIYTHIRMKLSL